MVPLLWALVAALTVGAAVTLLDHDVEWEGRKIGRPLYGALVLGGLLVVYAFVTRSGWMPLPGWLVLAFAVTYLPFLSSAFIDLETTDAHAVRELERLLLEKDLRELRHATGHGVIRDGRRRLRVHWECRVLDDGVLLELDVHPSLLPVTVSRPHVVHVRDTHDLERIRREIRRRHGGDPGTAA